MKWTHVRTFLISVLDREKISALCSYHFNSPLLCYWTECWVVLKVTLKKSHCLFLCPCSCRISVAQLRNSWLGRLVLSCLDHTQLQTHTHTNTGSSLNEWSARRWLHNTQQTNIHSLSEIRTHNLINRAAADLRIRQHSRWDQLTLY
jgi:hypothetical protein